MSLLSEGVVGEGVVGAWAIASSLALPSARSPVAAVSSTRSAVALSSGSAPGDATLAADAGGAGGRNNSSGLTDFDTLPHPVSPAIRKEQPSATETRRRRPVTVRGKTTSPPSRTLRACGRRRHTRESRQL